MKEKLSAAFDKDDPVYQQKKEDAWPRIAVDGMTVDEWLVTIIQKWVDEEKGAQELSILIFKEFTNIKKFNDGHRLVLNKFEKAFDRTADDLADEEIDVNLELIQTIRKFIIKAAKESYNDEPRGRRRSCHCIAG